MKREYRRDLQNNYLILEAPKSETEEEYALQMLLQNRVRGLLQIHSTSKDGMRYLHYEITSKQTLESLFENKPMEYQDILLVLSGIRDAAEDMRRYLLSAQHLLFSPDLIYVLPDRGGIQLCYYTGEHTYPISFLAEFILKKLDHRDPAAVALGYGLYDRASRENFSLDQTLKELLDSSVEPQTHAESLPEPAQTPPAEDPEGIPEEKDVDHDREDTGGIPVEHRDRKKKRRSFFSVIHPAVLLSFLLLVIALEVAMEQNLFTLMEAGGLFFLILAIEMLVNHGLHGHSKKEKPVWAEEDSDEEYEELLGEMYEERPAEEPIGETSFLLSEEDSASLRLIPVPGRSQKDQYPDICPTEKPLYIGKSEQEADIILPAATVSRMHARIQMRGTACYVQDMNSKNGTFVNGKRLSGQEECEIHREDEVAFAEVRYRVD